MLAFGGCLWGSFHFDDYSLFTTQGLALHTRPLLYITFWLNHKLSGQNPALWHAFNLLLHLVAAVLLRIVLGRLIPAPAALTAAAIFALHPFAAEPVNYVFARGTLLCTVLCLASLNDWTRGHYWRAVPWFAAALLAKEECAALPVLLIMLYFSATRDARQRAPIAVMFALSLAAGIRTILVGIETPGSGIATQSGIPAIGYLLTQGEVILRYLRLLVIPWGFTVDPDIRLASGWIPIAAWATVLGLAALAAWRFGHAGFWFLAGLVLLLPSSSIFPAADLAADRRMYLPMIAFSACAVLLLPKRPLVLIPILAVLTVLSFQRTKIWRTEESLWSDAVEKAPNKIRPRLQLARALPLDRGIQLLEQTKTIAPDDPRVASEQGRLYLRAGNPNQALVEFGRALALDPSSAGALNNRGAALLAMGQTQAAVEDFQRALARDPCQMDARHNLLHLGIATAPPPATCAQ